MPPRYQAPVVTKAFKVLRLVARSGQGVSLSDLSRKLGISKGTVHGITCALEEAGAVIRDTKTKRYAPGVTLLELGRAAYARVHWKDLARPVMEDLMEKTQESVFLGTRNGDHVSILEVVESGQDLKIAAPVGTRIPLLAGATGKIVLASMDDARVRALIEKKGLLKYTDHTITDPGRFLEEIDAVRRNGYAVDDEEYLSGVRAVAAGIRGNGHLPSAIWVVGFTARITDDKMRSMAEQTRAAAAAISRSIETHGTERTE